jgi:hypothetical protein
MSDHGRSGTNRSAVLGMAWRSDTKLLSSRTVRTAWLEWTTLAAPPTSGLETQMASLNTAASARASCERRAEEPRSLGVQAARESGTSARTSARGFAGWPGTAIRTSLVVRMSAPTNLGPLGSV